VVEVFKCINNLNPTFMSNTFDVKNVSYEMRDNHKLVLPHFNTIKYGKKSFKYYGAHLYNLMPVYMKANTDLQSFKKLVSTWEGPNCTCDICNFVF